MGAIFGRVWQTIVQKKEKAFKSKRRLFLNKID